jgi:hypothetical protein
VIADRCADTDGLQTDYGFDTYDACFELPIPTRGHGEKRRTNTTYCGNASKNKNHIG